MIENRIIKLLEKSINKMYERCNHFFVVLRTNNNFDFVVISSIGNEYKNILKNNSYNDTNYKYFIGLKKDSNKLTNGLYDNDNNKNSVIHTEPLYEHDPEFKYGRSMIEEDSTERIKNAMSSYSDYTNGSWSDFQDIYTEMEKISKNTFVKNSIIKDITMWDDGTYELEYFQKNLSDNHKKLIKNELINENHEQFLNTIYKQSFVRLKYKWDMNRVIHSLTIFSYKEPSIQVSYKLNEYNISPKFDYITPVSKSPVLFDFNK